MSCAQIALEALETFAQGLDHPEGICVTPSGEVYVGGEAGQIYHVVDDDQIREVANTGGFILGLAADAESRIYAIDSTGRCVWRVEPETGTTTLWAAGPTDRPFHTPNFGAFDSRGAYYLTDSGEWGKSTGCIWRVPPGGSPEIWTEESASFPNGVALSSDGSSLYVLESYPGALVEIPIAPDGSAGARKLLCDLDPAVPDGVAVTEDGALYIACYRPDVIYRWHMSDGLSVVAADPRGTVLAAPTNLVFVGHDRKTLLVPNIGRWHITRLRTDVAGIPPCYPTREQLGS